MNKKIFFFLVKVCYIKVFLLILNDILFEIYKGLLGRFQGFVLSLEKISSNLLTIKSSRIPVKGIFLL